MRQTTVALWTLLLAWFLEITCEAPTVTAGPPNAVIKPTFDSISFWYAPLADNAPIDPNSANLVTAFKEQKALGSKNIVGINTESYASPIYVANKDMPTVAP